jgi:hypothetical protein
MFGSLSIGIWDLFVIWCLKFVILSNFILLELVSHLFGNVETFSHLSLTAMGFIPARKGLNPPEADPLPADRLIRWPDT